MIITTIQQLHEALDHPSQNLALATGQILVNAGVITQSQLDTALTAQKGAKNNEKIGRILKRMGFADGEKITRALALNLGLPMVKLTSLEPSSDALERVPTDFARTHDLIPLIVYRNKLIVAMVDPTRMDVISMLNFIAGAIVEPVLATDDDIDYAISRWYGNADDVQAFNAIKETLPESEQKKATEQRHQAEDKPIVRLVQNLILDAINQHASDIHIRPKINDVDILFRIDGSLIPIRNFPKTMLPAVVGRIKIIGGMNISERRVPQDGRTKVTTRGKKIDLRISVMPSVQGESVVIRILDTSIGLKEIRELGLSPKDEERFENIIHRSSGIFLVTGPTGSGKSTTLYSALQAVKDTQINIITVEDPVEYEIEDIVQIQVNRQTGYTFARALRNILRHDPDTIMIGEIRDEETAKIAIESALTGHLVLSTLHTNSAAATITRLLEIGLQPYLVNATLIGVLAQRLVKQNCKHCLEAETVSELVRSELNLSISEPFFKGRGCDHCHNTGYNGRLATYELLTVDECLRQHIHEDVSVDALHGAAVKAGMVPLTEHAISLARAQKTSIAEVYRVRLE
ncbi:MAG: Flp pilus assembly complex ATPase component TadA [Pseudomonadales bacterium]|nr:Flp pilus assembly complex ATPase component TadA [Pseudomonadales bacterium]